MKRIFFIVLFALVATNGFAQEDRAVTEMLRQKYAYVNFINNVGYGIFYTVNSTGKNVKGKYGACNLNGDEIIPCIYDGIWSLNMNEGYAIVVINNKYENISIKREQHSKQPEIDTNILRQLQQNKIRETETSSFRDFANSYVESRINDWQQKGEFEKTADWQQRVNESARKAKTAEFLKEAEQVYIAERSKNFNANALTLGAYDADNETYMIKSVYGDWLMNVPINEAPSFRDNWNSMKKTPKYFVSNDQLAISEMMFTSANGKVFNYKLFNNAIVDTKNEPVVIASNNQVVQQNQQNNVAGNAPETRTNAGNNQSVEQSQQNISTVEITTNESDSQRQQPSQPQSQQPSQQQEQQLPRQEQQLHQEQLPPPQSSPPLQEQQQPLVESFENNSFQAYKKATTKIGVQTGVNFSTLSGWLKDLAGPSEDYIIRKPGILIGFFDEQPFKYSNFGWQSGILFTQLGTKMETNYSFMGSKVRETGTINVNVLLMRADIQYRIALTNGIRLTLHSGFYAGYGLWLSNKYEMFVDGKKVDGDSEVFFGDITGKAGEVGLGFGAALSIRDKVRIGAGYDLGILFHNTSITLTYMFGK